MRKKILKVGLLCDALAIGVAIYGASIGNWWIVAAASTWLLGDGVAVYILLKRHFGEKT